MKEVIFYLIMFVLVYLFYVVFVLCRKNVLKKFPEGKEVRYLKQRYEVKVNDKNLKKVANIIFLSNSFILSTTVFVISFFDSIILQILVGFVTLIVLILGVYHIMGICLKNK